MAIMLRNVRQILRRHIPQPVRAVIRNLKAITSVDLISLRNRIDPIEADLQQVSQYLVRQSYSTAAGGMLTRSPINDYELSVYSQNGEDGVLLYLFAKVGTTDRVFVEFGMGDGSECNTSNLSINFGWSGLLMDGGAENIQRARAFYDRMLGERSDAVVAACEWITRENINDLITKHGISGEIDLLSIDIDGNDYWVWEAIDCISPRVVVIEYNPTFGSEAAVTVPYDPAFQRRVKHLSGYYHGASLQALAKLASRKGYLLAGCDSRGVNAFFLREDVAARHDVEGVSPRTAFFPSFTRSAVASTEDQFRQIQHLDLVQV